ncbi:hypothetical protein ACFLSG_00780 [Candidatus Bipolaricaulota bacterium]
MLGHDDPYWHTDLDTIEKVDPTRLKHVGSLVATLSALPSWGSGLWQMPVGWLVQRMPIWGSCSSQTPLRSKRLEHTS